jgi:hypothetical protein
MALNELLIHGRCSSCGNSLQLNFNIVEKENEKAEEVVEESSIDLNQALNPTTETQESNESTDLPSDAIRDLIGS